MPQRLKSLSFRNRYWWYLLAVGLTLYLVLPQLGSFNHSLTILSKVDWRFSALAVAAPLLAHISASLKYRWLAIKPIRFWPTLLVQVACLLASRLLPAGLGGLGLNYLYLRKARHTKAQAAMVVSLNDGLGAVGHIILLAVLVGISSRHWRRLLPSFGSARYIVVAALCGLIIMLLLTIIYRRRLTSGMRSVIHDLKRYRRQPERLIYAILASIVIAGAYALALWWSAAALHIAMTLSMALLIMTAGVAAATITPTPGGVIGAEAGLTAAMVAYGFPLPNAVAVTILYRLATYWLSLLFGGAALVVVERSGLVAEL